MIRLKGTTSFLVGIYQAGRPDARTTVKRFLDSDAKLRNSARIYHDQIFPKERNDLKSAFYAFVGKERKSQVPHNWLRLIEVQPTASRANDFEKHLPKEVREAVFAYRASKTAIYQRRQL